MRFAFHLLSLALTTIVSPIAEASSRIRNPIGALSTIQNATIHTPNHRVTALSHFDLTFTIRDDLYVKFNLEPNHDILADDAVISYLGPDGKVAYHEPVDRLREKVFKGSAWIQRPRSGHYEWRRVGWARVVVKDDGRYPFFEGAFSVNHDHHHIQSSSNYVRTKHYLDPFVHELDDGEEYMVIWRDSDILSVMPEQHEDLKRDVVEDVPSCQADVLGFNMDPQHPVYQGIMNPPSKSYGVMDFAHLFGKRQIDTTTGGNSGGVNLVSTIGDSTGCPTTNKVALVGVATDCTYTSSFNSSESLRQNVILQMNTASGIWEDTFKISLGLANITIQPADCPASPGETSQWNQECANGPNIQDRLNYFSEWRGTQRDTNSHWTLLSTCNTGSAVGLAWLGQACINTAYTTNNSVTGNGQTGGGGTETVTGANVVVRTSGANEWQIIAHETGHTYGAVHDCDYQTCADSDYVNSQQCCPLNANSCDAQQQYIMNPSTSSGITSFSPCTIGNICSAIGRKSVNTDCLSDNKNVVLSSGPQCGNGIVEAGEDCDCGGTDGCGGDSCCDPSTCTFRDGAVCDDANEDCCSGCQFVSQGTVCRASSSSCDPQEVCPGDSGNCPRDETTPDGESCGDGLQCASGQCTSRDEQCKTVMGSYTQGNDTHACDSQGCTISCASPEFGYGVCYGLQQNFLDGTECGGGGRCENGQCMGSSFGGEVRSWIDDHKAIVIGVCSAVGAIILLCILSCVRRAYKRRKMRKRMPVPPPRPPPGGWQGWNSRGPPSQPGQPPMGQQQSWNPNHGWYGAQHQQPTMSGARGGIGGWETPPPPPPAYAGRPMYG